MPPSTDPADLSEQAATVVADAAGPHDALVAAAATSPLDGPTPCRDWDLRALLQHLLVWTPVLAATGRRTAPEAAPDEAAVDLVTGDWPAALAAARADLVRAWSDPQAWTGTVTMGGPDPLPAPMIGDMVLGELVIHGWDLARTVGIEPRWPVAVLTHALRGVEQMGPQGREMGVYGPAVPTGADAALLDRVVALSGRDPRWTA
jgi:uncharacterized protein (TIGR03086 family)